MGVSSNARLLQTDLRSMQTTGRRSWSGLRSHHITRLGTEELGGNAPRREPRSTSTSQNLSQGLLQLLEVLRNNLNQLVQLGQLRWDELQDLLQLLELMLLQVFQLQQLLELLRNDLDELSDLLERL